MIREILFSTFIAGACAGSCAAADSRLSYLDRIQAENIDPEKDRIASEVGGPTETEILYATRKLRQDLGELGTPNVCSAVFIRADRSDINKACEVIEAGSRTREIYQKRLYDEGLKEKQSELDIHKFLARFGRGLSYGGIGGGLVAVFGFGFFSPPGRRQLRK